MRTRYVLLCLLCLNVSILKAQWNSDPSVNTSVCVAIDKQVDLRMMKDGTGGSYITWKDYRTGVPDIYIQRLSAAGIPLWTASGLALCTNTADQSTPAIATDMAGGAIVSWSDWRSNIERDIYAQRVDSNGNILWTADGVVVTDKPDREHNPKIISDNAGGLIVTWEQQTGGLWDIWAQRLSGAGLPLWTAGGIPLCNVSANRINPKIQDDGQGGAIIAWQDERNGVYDIYAQRVDKNGNLKWGAGGKLICDAPDTQTDPKIDPDSSNGGSYIVWIDRRSFANYDIYAQRLDSNGNALWTANGIPVCNAPGSQAAQDILSNNGTDGLIVTWKDKRNGNYDIYAQKLNNAGTALWAANGIPVCSAPKDQLNPNIIEDKNGGAIILWQDSSAGSFDIKAQRIDAAGNFLWTMGGVNVGSATGDQVSAKNVTDGNGGSIFAFQDRRSGDYDIYAHHLYSNGTTTAPLSTGSLLHTASLSCYPNPFTDALTITLSLADNEPLTVNGYNLTGIKVPSLVPERITRQNGKCTIYINTSPGSLSAGVYFLELKTGSRSEKLRVIKLDAE